MGAACLVNMLLNLTILLTLGTLHPFPSHGPWYGPKAQLRDSNADVHAVGAAAVVAGTTAAAAYIDAKFHLSKDVQALARVKIGERGYAKAVASQRESCWYFFEEAVQKDPNNVSIWSRDGCYTSTAVYEQALRYAAFFLELGVEPGQLVAFYLQNQPEFIFAWLGLWAIGCAPAMINFNLSGDALVHCLKISGARYILVDENNTCQGRINNERSRIEGDLNLKPIVLNKELKKVITTKQASRPDDSYRTEVKGNFPATLFYTSGTTGLPKGATFSTSRTHMGAIMYTSLGHVFNQRPGRGGDRWYISMPFYHGTGGHTAISLMMSGVSVAIGNGFSVRNFWSDVRDSEATFFVYVGESVRYLLAAPPSPLDKQHKVRCMFGNGLRPDVWLRFQERFGVEQVAEFFNSSEGIFSLLNWDCGNFQANCVGHHGALFRLILRDIFVPVEVDYDTNELVRDPKTGFVRRKSYEEGGEIIVRIPEEAYFAGYWNNPAATKKKFAYNVLKKGDIFYRTGDALRRTSDGRWYFLDRLGDTYRWKSENVSTAEVAQIIGHFPGVLEANVYGVSIPHHEGRAGCAALSIAPELRDEFDWRGLVVYANERLPRYAVPAFVRVLSGEVGSNAMHNGKQNKTGLRAEGVEPGKRGSQVAGGGQDTMRYLKPGSGTYVPFEKGEWEQLLGGRARL